MAPRRPQRLVLAFHSNRGVVISPYGLNLHFLMTNSAKYFFTGLLTTQVFPFVKCLFRSFAHFSIRLSAFFLLICRNKCVHITRFYISMYTYFIYIENQDMSSLLDIRIANIFSYSVACLFVPLMVFLINKQFLNFNVVQIIFSFKVSAYYCPVLVISAYRRVMKIVFYIFF